MSYDSSSYSHDWIALQPRHGEFTLNVVDEGWRKLPDCTITIIDQKGESIAALSPIGTGYGQPRTEIPVVDGRITFADFRPGRHIADLRYKNFPPVRANFVLPESFAGELYLQIDGSIEQFSHGEQYGSEHEEGDAK